MSRQRRRAALKERFGSEYERTLRFAGSAKGAEAQLQERVESRNSLHIRALTAAQRDQYQQEWRRIQADFVDLPQASLGRADVLIERMMNDRGYPVQQFNQKANLISVDHPEVVENYRQAHGVFAASLTEPVSVEDARCSILAYRSLYSELMGSDGSGRNVHEQLVAPEPADEGENRV